MPASTNAPEAPADLAAAVEALEGRIGRLEETAFFQEERLKELDSALTAQQAQLDAMERQLADLGQLARSLRDKLADAPENALPPHSMPERY
ncbi:MAG: SlyX family protein [Desulfovibrio sp.]|nr:SlyX family protein [Desulfovibrio sp.]